MSQTLRKQTRSTRPFDKSGRVLTCAKCHRTMAFAKKQWIEGKRRDVCRPCRGEA